jgi:hypothetical protein
MGIFTDVVILASLLFSSYHMVRWNVRTIRDLIKEWRSP